jgi:hypothetical protein
MKGFILNIRKAKNEDVIVTVLSKSVVKKYYRFYGQRHSILQVGNLIDFKVEDSKSYLPRLRGATLISFSWSFSKDRFSIWQNFIRIFEANLRDATDISSFYFSLLLEKANRWHKQNPKRLAIEAYLELLDYEKRLYISDFCYFCNGALGNEVSISKRFFIAHPSCISEKKTFNRGQILKLLNSKSTIDIDDNQIEDLFVFLSL